MKLQPATFSTHYHTLLAQTKSHVDTLHCKEYFSLNVQIPFCKQRLAKNHNINFLKRYNPLL